jgi:hypothetical protein
LNIYQRMQLCLLPGQNRRARVLVKKAVDKRMTLRRNARKGVQGSGERRQGSAKPSFTGSNPVVASRATPGNTRQHEANWGRPSRLPARPPSSVMQSAVWDTFFRRPVHCWHHQLSISSNRDNLSRSKPTTSSSSTSVAGVEKTFRRSSSSRASSSAATSCSSNSMLCSESHAFSRPQNIQPG